MGAERLRLLFDEGSFTELDAYAKSDGESAGVVTGYGLVEGIPVFAFSQDPDERGGAVGRVHAVKIRKMYDMAVKTGAPVVGIYDSKGARLTEGFDTLDSYGEMLRYSCNLSGVVPQISVIAGVCAGSMAMVASAADFLVMSKDAELFLQDSSGGSAEDCAMDGLVHLVADDAADAIKKARMLLARLPMNNLSAEPVFDEIPAAVQLTGSETGTEEILAGIFDAESILLLQEEYSEDIRCGFAALKGAGCGFVFAADRPGNFCCTKAARFVSVCDAFQIPVVTVINAAGLRADARNAAKLASVYAEATTVKIAVITGEAFGPAYVALAGRSTGTDLTLAWKTAVISPLAPEAAVEMLYADEITAETSRESLVQRYRKAEASAFAAAAGGYIEEVIEAAETRDRVASALEMMSGKRVTGIPKKHANLPL